MEELTILETPIFTAWATSCMSDENYRLLQLSLLTNPTQGRIIKGSGGIRKVRWGSSDRGKRGGFRVIYFLALSHGKILMLFGYSKGEASDLTKDQVKELGQLVKEEFK